MDTNSFVVTADGSKTLYHSGIGEHYHSQHGAVQESKHVFVGMGLSHFLNIHEPEVVSILEIGLGTGLNFLLSADFCMQKGVQLDYVGVEAHPLPSQLVAQTGYDRYVSASLWASFLRQYSGSWHTLQALNADCLLTAVHCEILHFTIGKQFDVLYFDAFASTRQPEMWTEETLQHVTAFLKPGGIFVTYAITGHLKRTLKALGFTVEKVPGAPGKREMLRAIKM
ncbi:tRNA (5-methylaminomethyl-2-thiouridine)(34)-methyltransferase MnmD [Parapedobacter indicus]|uniref:tRNA U34 5-methylaminomethyl-2-thiouridine-forming methyltransferase MnmC n=1 Tax=Parapedobacter indicus TaxID=1477437 RepID=A0A1I3PN27_9SPHI|nr:tRNA (5-methylaminomethyl-2-thiouridine)(34)-methyltransferase MnmD [Parapedobacter indicus]PPL00513.1 tRNA U34 5-methylaminomethyl-2-thiouridine-forming methyltransferase MnmC [Parapedobacter indicus]SFJ22912.1 tRNA U34 5-methylaminomethyl-2-thiouridine-forming methyltransferase MnmC [Parapedobacter indicus]